MESHSSKIQKKNIRKAKSHRKSSKNRKSHHRRHHSHHSHHLRPIFPPYDEIEVGYRNKPANYDFHDKALKKASHLQYQYANDSNIDSQLAHKTIFVGRLQNSIAQEIIYNKFQQAGLISQIKFIYDKVSGERKNYCFIIYQKEKYAAKALYQFQNISINNSHLIVDYMRTHNQENWKPRRLGGGLGGRIKSSQVRFGERSVSM